ncbi:MAG: membrane dipeptidase, partial [Planctomycetes bacterium]|nr:membrane dipeptidase [Planctomycetota bacterium]
MIPIFDGHNDVLLRLVEAADDDSRGFLSESDRGHLDLPRARRGGMVGGFFAVFVPGPEGAAPRCLTLEDGREIEMPAEIDRDWALPRAVRMASRLHRIVEASR